MSGQVLARLQELTEGPGIALIGRDGLRSLVLLCGISGLLTGVISFPFGDWKTINNCPVGWAQLDSHCYRFINQERTFEDAENICLTLSGNLVSIQNQLENTFVLELIQEGNGDGLIWIGFTDEDMEGTFVWTDGSTVNFKNFDDINLSEPDGSGNCVAIDATDGLWQDDPCTDTKAFVCIRDVVRH
ncbi:snaclec CHH-B subunit beta-like [Syngnathoides biaculeatus]|uniref:snaclec CHH-B subunit beta-like n=1 Tax=Syngnathoides biaculeatus TaxID=300417 RepID=UPI002ADE0E31|nr:snaclec CHH-B subunit beta-like [Syngnathoides biaculeatus]